jgi:hypothetical protein
MRHETWIEVDRAAESGQGGAVNISRLCELACPAREVPFKSEEVVAALDLLVRHGFAESCVLREKWFRVIVDSPSPMEAAEMLQLVELPAH